MTLNARHALPAALVAHLRAEYGISPAVLFGPSRAKRHVLTRWALSAAYRQQGYSLLDIGVILGGRDHTTISHGLAQQPRDAAWQEAISTMAAMIPPAAPGSGAGRVAHDQHALLARLARLEHEIAEIRQLLDHE